MNALNFRIKVSGDLCHRSGYVQNAAVKELHFSGPTSKVISLAPGSNSLTVFVGANSGRKNVDYSVELIPDPSIELHLTESNPLCARTVGPTGFMVIDLTLS